MPIKTLLYLRTLQEANINSARPAMYRGRRISSKAAYINDPAFLSPFVSVRVVNSVTYH
jgi:hypothetical protein